MASFPTPTGTSFPDASAYGGQTYEDGLHPRAGFVNPYGSRSPSRSVSPHHSPHSSHMHGLLPPASPHGSRPSSPFHTHGSRPSSPFPHPQPSGSSSLYPPQSSYPPPLGTPPPPTPFGGSTYPEQTSSTYLGMPSTSSYPPPMSVAPPISVAPPMPYGSSTSTYPGQNAPYNAMGFMPSGTGQPAPPNNFPSTGTSFAQGNPPPYTLMPSADAPLSFVGEDTNSKLFLGVIVPEATPHNTSMVSGFDVQRSVRECYDAMKGFGTDEKRLNGAIAPLNPFQIEALKKAFQTSHGKDLIKRVKSETSRDYETAIVGKLRGPVEFDCWLLKEACKGIGTNESVLNEVLLNRSNFEIELLKTEYHRLYGKDLQSVVKSELSFKTKDLFVMALAGNRGTVISDGVQSRPGVVDHEKVEKDVNDLYAGGEGRMGTNEGIFCQVLVNSGPDHLRAVVQRYQQIHGLLSIAIKKEFSGHMRDALLHITRFYEDDSYGIHRDFTLIEDSMRGLGTKEFALTYRLLRAHWDTMRFAQIKQTYQSEYGKSLLERVRGEISGDYRDFMVRLIQ